MASSLVVLSALEHRTLNFPPFVVVVVVFVVAVVVFVVVVVAFVVCCSAAAEMSSRAAMTQTVSVRAHASYDSRRHKRPLTDDSLTTTDDVPSCDTISCSRPTFDLTAKFKASCQLI